MNKYDITNISRGTRTSLNITSLYIKFYRKVENFGHSCCTVSNSYRIWGQLIGSDPRKHRAGVGIYKPNKGQKNHTNQGHCVSAMIALAPRNEPTKTHLDLIYFHFCPHCCVGGQNGIIVVLKRGLFMTKILRKCPNNLYIGCI